MIFVSSLEFQVGPCLYVTAAVKAASRFGTAYVAAAAEVCSRFIGTCWSLSFSVDPFPLPAMFPSPAGLNPVDGVAMRAQTILHREILHLHGLVILAISLLRTRFATLSPSFLDFVTSPHLQVQIRGLDSAIRQATQAIQTGVHYLQELLTTFGMRHTLNCDTAQLDAELRGRTTFPDPRLPSFHPFPVDSPTTRRTTSTSSTPATPSFPPTRPPANRPPHRPLVTTSNRTLSIAESRPSTTRSRSRSHPRLNPRLFPSREENIHSIPVHCPPFPLNLDFLSTLHSVNSTFLIIWLSAFPRSTPPPFEPTSFVPSRSHVCIVYDDLDSPYGIGTNCRPTFCRS